VQEARRQRGLDLESGTYRNVLPSRRDVRADRGQRAASRNRSRSAASVRRREANDARGHVIPGRAAALVLRPLSVPQGDAFAFGPFQLETRSKRLLRDREPIAISARQFDLLCALVSKAGEVLSKDQLIEIAWRDVAVTDNSLEQAISGLRRVLSTSASDEYIRTEARRGYRFAATVTRIVTRESDAALDALLAPHRAWMEGRAALETLERERIAHARDVFDEVLQRVPDHASVHVGLANACVMQFETTRADQTPD